jgi:hypothetical protein
MGDGSRRAERKFARREFMSSTLDFETVARRMTGGRPDMMFLRNQLNDNADTGHAYEVDSTSFIMAAAAIKKAGLVKRIQYWLES